jgi:hypothetical protein
MLAALQSNSVSASNENQATFFKHTLSVGFHVVISVLNYKFVDNRLPFTVKHFIIQLMHNI